MPKTQVAPCEFDTVEMMYIKAQTELMIKQACALSNIEASLNKLQSTLFRIELALANRSR